MSREIRLRVAATATVAQRQVVLPAVDSAVGLALPKLQVTADARTSVRTLARAEAV